MKTILSVICFSAFCSYHAAAQTATSTSSKKNTPAQIVAEPAQPVQPAKATVVTSGKNAEIKEVPLENSQTAVPEKKETSSARKPD
jgi:hypothetical protein